MGLWASCKCEGALCCACTPEKGERPAPSCSRPANRLAPGMPVLLLSAGHRNNCLDTPRSFPLLSHSSPPSCLGRHTGLLCVSVRVWGGGGGVTILERKACWGLRAACLKRGEGCACVCDICTICEDPYAA